MRIISILLLVLILLSCKQKTNKTYSESSLETVSATESFSYQSKLTKQDKRKYYDSNGQIVYEIKYKTNTFKLRTASSDLLWKIKLYDNKIKISNNEDNLNPYEIKFIDTHESKLVKNDFEIARLTSNNSDELLLTKNKTEKVSIHGSYKPSILVDLISEIPKIHREIIKKELNRKGF